MPEAAGLDKRSPVGRHILTVALEDYFQATALSGVVPVRQWARFEKRVARNTQTTLDLLDACGARATFFVLGWIADEMPELVRQVVERGHEIASKGYHHRALREMTPEEFRDDLRRAREAIERAAGLRVHGHRIAAGDMGVSDLWALDVLAEEGFAYDSSFYPRLRSIGGEAWRRHAFVHQGPAGKIWEVPLTSLRLAGLSIPFAGGFYFRQLPHALARAVLRRWERRGDFPFVLHFHVWELDPNLPQITAANRFAHLRQHRNVHLMPARIQDLLRQHRFGSVADHLQLAPEAVSLPPPRPAPETERAPAAAGPRVPVTVVVPCYNEELVLPYLSNTLEGLKRKLGRSHDLSFVFVDDGSTDETWAQLQRIFGGKPDCTLAQQPRNGGVAAAILTGIRAARSEAVCSIDCDCTYDPLQLEGMLPLLAEGVDMVTASPYHPRGGVLNVPGWRLGLSRTLSLFYRLVLSQPLFTYTSCFRVYRRSAFADLKLRESGFLGVAEMVGLLALRGAKIAEYPALLEVRMLGRSKMKILRTILGHLRLLCHFGWLRLRRKTAPAAAPAVAPGSSGKAT